VLTGIDYQVEECPMAKGNRHLGLKEVLDGLEQQSPGAKAAFLFSFYDHGREHFVDEAAEERTELRPCPECGSPTTGAVCAFCSLRRRATPDGADDRTRGTEVVVELRTGS